MREITSETIEAFSNGDARAFDAIFMAFWQKLRVFAYKIVDNKEDAEEICQEVFMKLWVNRESIGSIQKINSYIFTMAKNHALNLLRDRKTYRAHMSDFHDSTAEHSDIADVMREEHAQLLIDMAAEMLPQRQREIFLLSNNGLSNEEVAAKLNISKRTVDNSLSQANAIIRQFFSVYLLLLVSNQLSYLSSFFRFRN